MYRASNHVGTSIGACRYIQHRTLFDLLKLPPRCIFTLHVSCSTVSQVRLTLEALCKMVTSMRSSDTPVISIIDGPCYGSGYALASGRYKWWLLGAWYCTFKSVPSCPSATTYRILRSYILCNYMFIGMWWTWALFFALCSCRPPFQAFTGIMGILAMHACQMFRIVIRWDYHQNS